MPFSYIHLKEHGIVIATYENNKQQFTSSEILTHSDLEDQILFKLVLDYREAIKNDLPELLKESIEMLRKYDCIIAFISENIEFMDLQIQKLIKKKPHNDCYANIKHRFFEEMGDALTWLKSI